MMRVTCYVLCETGSGSNLSRNTQHELGELMRILFLGTPSFAVSPLRRLVEAGHEIVAVVTQPDRPAGRSRAPQPPPVKQAALEFGLPVLQPETLRDEAAIAQLRDLRPEAGVVAAYGEIL